MTLESLLLRDDIPEDVMREIKLTIADQRKMKEEFLKTETRLQFLLKSSPAVIFSCEPLGTFPTNFMSENVKEITGHDAHEFVNNPSFWTNGIHPDDRQRVIDTFKSIVQTEHYSETYRFKHKDGSYLWMIDEASLIRDNQGNPTEIVGFWTDITKQKEAEEKLRKSEEEYRSLFENIPIGLYRSTPDHKFLAANPAFIKQTGMSSLKELLSTGIKQFAKRRNYERSRFLDEINVIGEVKGLESELKKSDGISIYIRENARAIRDSKGTIKYYEGSVEDITDRVLVEEALRESEKKYRNLIDNLSDIVAEVDSEGKFTFISPQSIEILGYKPEEALGRNGFDFIHPDDMERAVELFQGTSEEEQVYNFEYRARHKEGYYVPISASGKIIKEKDEYKLISILSDITERKNAEEALIKTKTRLEYLLKSSPAVIYTCEPWGNFQATFMSENVREITGYEVHDFVDHPEFWINGIYPDDRQHAEENFKDIIQKEHYSETYRFKHKDGSYHWMLDEATLIRDEKGNPIETVGYWTDITERKNAEEALKESEEKFRLLFESAPIAIGVSNLEGETIALNQKACEIMGYSADEIIKADLDKTYVNPEIRHKTIQELLSSGEIRDWEVQRIRKNGSKYYVKVNAQIVEEGGQKVILSTMQDITKTKIAEEKIQRSEERYRMLFNESPVSLWELDGSKVKHYIDNLISKGITDLRVYFEIHPEEVDKVIKSVKVLDINTATLKLYRATRKKDLQDLSVIFGEDSLIAFKELILSEGKQAFEIETVNYTLNGERIHVLIRSTIVPGHEESFARMIVSVVDITDRVRMIKALRESEEKFRMLFDESPISIWEEDFSQIRQHINHLKATGVKDIEKYLDEHPEEVKKLAGMIKILDINATSLKMYKAKEKQDFFKGIEVLFREESYLVFKQEIIALFNGHMKFESDQINYTLNGERIHILLKRTIVPGYEESWSRVIVSIVDITDRVEMEKALRESEERLRAFMDSATDSFLLLDSELNIIEVNQNLAIRWNFNKHELIGKNIIDLRERAVFDSPVEYTERFTQLLDVIRTGSLYDEEFTILHPIHGKRYTSVRAFKVGTGLGIISRDITQQKEAELVRRELEQRRENFIYMASHELRTPLTVISGYCDFLDKHDQFIDHDRRDKIISVMKSNVQRLERLTEDVGQVAQIEKEQFQVSKKKFNLCDFLHENLDQYNQLLGNQFTFQRCNTKHSIIITADPDRIQQVLENVISNAIKHTSKDKREINVKVELQDNSVQILISDNGAGIASEHLETIFDQFISFQTEYAAGGTGIGLYLSRRIMEAHGGTITAQSAGKGFGSTFIIELPK